MMLGEQVLFHQKVPLVEELPATLIPLSELRRYDEVAYRRAWAKYDDTPERQRLREATIPLLNRRWTEVVFLSPVHPFAIWRVWSELTGEKLPPIEFWAVPASRIETGTAVIYDRRAAGTSVGDPIDAAAVAPFIAADFRTMTSTTAENMEWLARLAAAGKRGAWWNLTPHVLVGVPVSVEGAAVIRWDEPPDDSNPVMS